MSAAFGITNNTPCKNCDRRQQGCHSKCESYAAWKETQSQQKWQSGRKYLKEFLIANPPKFKISSQCCDWAKKKPAKTMMKEGGFNLSVTGIRKAKGGVRSVSYKNCFQTKWEYDLYMPIFWYKNKDRLEYEEHFGIKHSDCYEKYGMSRTGCAACPFAGISSCNIELMVLRKHEQNLYKACKNVFADSYEYMSKYKKFCEERGYFVTQKEGIRL